jgi:osmoprotectant transport system permease protein
MLPLLGVGFVPALAALALLAVPPIAITSDLAFRGVPAAAIDAARGMGMTRAQTFFRVEWPVAFPFLFSGVRTAATEVIASAVLAAFIGAGGLGEYVTTGLQANDAAYLWTGVVAIAVIALAAEFALAAVQRRLERAV